MKLAWKKQLMAGGSFPNFDDGTMVPMVRGTKGEMGCSSCGSDEATCQTLAHSGAAPGGLRIEWQCDGDIMGKKMGI